MCISGLFGWPFRWRSGKHIPTLIAVFAALWQSHTSPLPMNPRSLHILILKSGKNGNGDHPGQHPRQVRIPLLQKKFV